MLVADEETFHQGYVGQPCHVHGWDCKNPLIFNSFSVLLVGGNKYGAPTNWNNKIFLINQITAVFCLLPHRQASNKMLTNKLGLSWVKLNPLTM